VSQPRPVRISRPNAAVAPSGDERRVSFAVGWVRNQAGEARARRIFGLFLGVLLVIYAAFAGLAAFGAGSGLRAAPVAWGIFTLLAALLALWGFALTFGKTPRSAQRRDADILVRERLGRIRRFPVESAASLRVVEHHTASFLGPLATQVVEIQSRERRRSEYLVGERFFEELAGL
jgi:hypothetical protein